MTRFIGSQFLNEVQKVEISNDRSRIGVVILNIFTSKGEFPIYAYHESDVLTIEDRRKSV